MIGWIWKLLPKNYRAGVAIKNIGIGLGKLATSLLVGSFGKDMAPEHIEAVGVAVTVVTQTGLEAIHDWARVKWPEAKWL